MQHRKRQITLKQRMGLCLAAFFAAFAMQLTLNGYQSRAVQAVQDAQMGCFNAISRFQGGVESSISVLENYRWENSEPEEIIDRLQSASSTCNAWLWRIGTSLNSLESVSDEQRVLYSAVDTVYQTYTGLLDELENDLLSGNDAAASQLYYAKVVPCGDYLSQYTLQLLETAIQDSQTTYTTISALNERITMLHVPDLAANAITSVTDNPYIIALLIDLIILVLGCIMDMAPIILIATPILLPIATSIGIDPIQFGIIVVLNCGIGLLTPPVGAVLFIGSAVAKRPMEKVVKATLPFYLCMFVALLLLTFIPDISLAIPKLLGGYVSPITNPLGPVFIH